MHPEHTDHPRALLQEGLSHHRAGRLADADRAYRAILEAVPGDPDALHLRGLIAGQSGQPDVAVDLIRDAIARRPGVGVYHANLAATLERAGRFGEAEAEARRALQYSPDSPTAMFTLANALCSRDQHEASIEVYRRTTRLRPGDFAVWSNLGTALGVLGRHDESAAALTEAVRLVPDRAEVVANLAGALRLSGRQEAAREAYLRALALDPALVTARADLGRLELEAGEPAAAAVTLSEALARRPGDVRALAALETALRQQGRTTEADDLLDLDRFVACRHVTAPEPYATVADFNAALASHVLAHPTLDPEPPSKTTRGGSQTRELLDDVPGPVALLERIIREAVQTYLEAMAPDVSHPWLSTRPATWSLTLWGTVLEPGGRQDPHIHPSGWLSGVYYVRLPVSEDAAEPEAGWIELGRPPPSLNGDAVARTRRFEPLEGRLLLFPSSCYHSTVPTSGAERRISIAFDIIPARPMDQASNEASVARSVMEVQRLLDSHLVEAAERLSRQLHAQVPDDPRVCHVRGRSLHSLGRHEEAGDLLRRAVAAMPENAAAHLGLAVHLAVTDDANGAVEHLRRTLELSSEEKVLFAVGRAYASLDMRTEAADVYRQIVERRPDAGHAHYQLTSLQPPATNDPRIDQMRATATSSTAHLIERSAACFGMGVALEQLGEYAEAFRWFRQGNDLRKAELPFDVAALRNEFDGMRRGFSQSLFQRDVMPGDPSELPVFVVGMPRSGTTLIEQILDSHPQITGVGELSVVRSLATRLQDRLPRGRSMPLDVHLVPDQAWRNAGLRYLDVLKVQSRNALRAVDKQPFNYMYVGPLRLMLPASRVIHSRRDPRDTCLSIYCLSFGSVPGFAYDLSDLGEAYLLYAELMDHWRQVVPGFFLDVDYETLVASAEVSIRRLVNFVGLAWDPACLDFHRNSRVVNTASRYQVKQPMYSSSVGRWRHYENELAPLLEKLAPVIRRSGART